MIVVLDTNVIISALLSSKGAPGKIMAYWEAEWFDVATSEALLDELERAFKYEKVQKYFRQPQEKIDALLTRLKFVGTVVEPEVELRIIPDDPDDNKVIECAVATKASFIISGDEHLLNLKEFMGIIILPPAGFVKLLELEQG